MSETSGKVDPKHYRPTGAIPKLVPTALRPFRALLWFGIILAATGVIVMMALRIAAGVSIMQIALPFFIGAGVVAGLGRRVGEHQPDDKT